MAKCEYCTHSELIDGTLHCHYKCRDVLFSDQCNSFVNDLELVTMYFSIKCMVDSGDVRQLGEELALFLQESWFNGEDVLEVEFEDYDVIN